MASQVIRIEEGGAAQSDIIKDKKYRLFREDEEKKPFESLSKKEVKNLYVLKKHMSRISNELKNYSINKNAVNKVFHFYLAC
jgi:hypothetical protein